MADSIETLLNKPSEQWTLEELKAGFVAALYKLNQANECITEHDKLANSLQALLEQYKANNDALLATVVSLQPLLPHQSNGKVETPKRRRGRPLDKKKADLQWVCDWYLEAREKYGWEISVTCLIREFFADSYESLGMRRSRVNDPETKSKLNTFRTDYVSPARGILQARGLLRK